MKISDQRFGLFTVDHNQRMNEANRLACPYSYKWRDSILWLFDNDIPQEIFELEMIGIEGLIKKGHVVEFNQNTSQRHYSLYIELDSDRRTVLMCLNGQDDIYHEKLLVPIADYFVKKGYTVALDWDLVDITQVENKVFENADRIYDQINQPDGVDIYFNEQGHVNYGWSKRHSLVFIEPRANAA